MTKELAQQVAETGRLPDKLSGMIRLSVRDLELVEKDERYKVDMRKWHGPHKGRCLVCLGGAVLAKSLNGPIECFINPYAVDPHNRDRIIAMDKVRKGKVLKALAIIDHIPRYRLIKAFRKLNGTVTPYEKDAAQFKSDLLVLADKLEELGE